MENTSDKPLKKSSPKKAKVIKKDKASSIEGGKEAGTEVTSTIKKTRKPSAKKSDRVAVVAGLRTPFVRQSTSFKSANSLDLGKMVVKELLIRMELDAQLIEQLVFGSVLAIPEAPNIAREIILGNGMNVNTDAFSVSKACATGYQTTACVADSIRLGRISIGISGGADSSSVVPIQVSKRLSAILVALGKARSMSEKLKLLSQLRPGDLIPVPPSVTEYSTGLTMGQNAEQMARDHNISRIAQDDFAHRSHQLASKAWELGCLDNEVMTCFVEPFNQAVSKDNNIRFDSQREAYDKLRPAFDKLHGTVTAANATPLTDGASALLLMSEERAKADGYQPLGYIRAYSNFAIGARTDMLMGPSYATPKVLAEMKMKLSDISLIDMHEAFAAQTLCNIQAFASKKFAQEKLGRDEIIGEIDMNKFNVLGGSIAYGHPFAATGGRQITQLLGELKRRGGGFGLATACAAGGLASAMIVEAE